MYSGPQDVSGNVNGMSGINFASGISGIGHTNIKKLKFQQCPGCEETLLEESALIYIIKSGRYAHQNTARTVGSFQMVLVKNEFS